MPELTPIEVPLPMPELLSLYQILTDHSLDPLESFGNAVNYAMTLYNTKVPNPEIVNALHAYWLDTEDDVMIYSNDTYCVLMETGDSGSVARLITVFVYDCSGELGEEVLVINTDIKNPFYDTDTFQFIPELLFWYDEAKEDTRDLLIFLHTIGVILFRDHGFGYCYKGKPHVHML